ncbi:MAG: SIR2 family NAD-dependent protein deacylase [Promethearchaeota archaeon]
MGTNEDKIEHLADLIVQANNIVVLTGAGISTESGIPDFRSPGTGLWETHDPYEFASIDSFVANAGKVMNDMLKLGLEIFRSRPNKGHRALTRLQKMGKLKGVLTQNIDRLHHKAKTKNIIELHGNVMEAKCMHCGRIFSITSMVNQALRGEIPACEICNGTLKPNAIFFNEALESKVLQDADDMLDDCDLLIVLGSSLLVYPVAWYPRRAFNRGAKLAIINIQETDMDELAEVVIHEKIGDIMPKVIKIVEMKLQ